MTFELREYRALAIAFAAGLAGSILFGVGWWLPLVTIVVAVAVYQLWRY